MDEFLVAQSICCAAKVLRNIEHVAPHLLHGYISCTTEEDQYDQRVNAARYEPSAVISPVLPVFMSGLLSLLERNTEAERLACLEAIVAYTTSSPRAFLVLLSSELLLTHWLDLLRRQPNIQASTLHTIAQVGLYFRHIHQLAIS